MPKIIKLEDEHGLYWTVLPTNPIFDNLNKAGMKPDEYACYREHISKRFGTDEQLKYSYSRLEEITNSCLDLTSSDEALLSQLLHAARAYATLYSVVTRNTQAAAKDQGSTSGTKKRSQSKIPDQEVTERSGSTMGEEETGNSST